MCVQHTFSIIIVVCCIDRSDIALTEGATFYWFTVCTIVPYSLD